MPRVQDPKTGKFVRTKPDYKAMYENIFQVLDEESERLEEAQEQRDFLLNHCGPICKWMYKRKFMK